MVMAEAVLYRLSSKRFVSDKRVEQQKAARVAVNSIEQHDRLHNLRIRELGVHKEDNCVSAIVSLIKDKLYIDGISKADNDTAHRLPLRHRDGRSTTDNQRPRSKEASTTISGIQRTLTDTVIFRFVRRDVRNSVIQKRPELKNTGISITKDLTALNIELLNCLMNSSDVKSAWSWQGKVYAELNNGVNVRTNPFQPIDDLLKGKL